MKFEVLLTQGQGAPAGPSLAHTPGQDLTRTVFTREFGPTVGVALPRLRISHCNLSGKNVPECLGCPVILTFPFEYVTRHASYQTRISVLKGKLKSVYLGLQDCLDSFQIEINVH
jgi:hypothetical protein